MIGTQHFISVSGGKDSTAVACLAVERREKRGFGNLPPRFLAADTGNEHESWRPHIDYLADALGIEIEIVKADFSAQFATRRDNIRTDWSKEKRTKKHTAECKDRRMDLPFAHWREACDCPVRISPAVPQHLIEEAIELLVPTGNPFLDLCMLKGRFPGAKSRFCTDETKLAPMMLIKQPYLDDGVNIIEWIGERAEESPSRARKPVLQRIRHDHATQVLYRPIHSLTALEVFAIAKRHGLKPNPLYLKGAKRVGCWPCIMCGKDEVALIAKLTPHEIDRLRSWERLVQLVSRRRNATFFAAKVIPGDDEDEARAHIDAVVEWAGTSRGGKQFDMLQQGLFAEAVVEGAWCDSIYGLCE